MPDTVTPLVSVIVPHYNDLDNLGRCLESLRRQMLPGHRFEVIVSDNNSPCGLAAVAAVARDACIVTASEQGAGPARNAGAAIARGVYLAFIDSDCIAEADWLSKGVSILDRFDYAGGRVVTTIAAPGSPTLAEAFESVFAFNFKKYIEKDKFSGSGNLFVPQRIFEQVGGFRARVSEDVEWCRRANAMGFRLGYAEGAVVYHPARREWSALTRRWDRVMLEDIYLAMERPWWRLRWAFYAAVVAASPLVHWFPIVRDRRMVGLRAKGRSFLGLCGIRSYRSYRMFCLLIHPPK